jgi:AP endonuclease-1
LLWTCCQLLELTIRRANSFALFLKSQRKWENPPLQDENKKLWHSACKEHSYDTNSHVLPHGSYLVNLAQSEAEKAKQAYDAFVDDLKRCEALGIRYYNFHPGNTGPHPRAEAISRIANSLNRAIKETKTVKPVLETMAGGSNVIGSTFEDLRDIIAQVEDKSRIGVCIDTCHIFAAGYDLRTPETFKATMDQFQSIVDMRYLSAFHLNDSKAPFGSHRDLHQNIGLGFLGLRAFHSVMNDTRFEGLPMVLETPIDSKDENGKAHEDKGVWAKEIKLLERLIGMDPEGLQFKALEKRLADEGAAERGKHADQQKRKKEKEAKSEATKLKRTKKKKKSASTESDQSD